MSYICHLSVNEANKNKIKYKIYEYKVCINFRWSTQFNSLHYANIQEYKAIKNNFAHR